MPKLCRDIGPNTKALGNSFVYSFNWAWKVKAHKTKLRGDKYKFKGNGGINIHVDYEGLHFPRVHDF